MVMQTAKPHIFPPEEQKEVMKVAKNKKWYILLQSGYFVKIEILPCVTPIFSFRFWFPVVA